MNKTELLADLATKVLRIVETTEQVDPVKNAAGVRSYVTNVMEVNKSRVTGRNIGWYTIDEGQAEEAAYYRDVIAVPQNDYVDAATYLAGLGFVKFKAAEIDAELGYVIADVWEDNGDDTITKKQVMVYREGGTPVHKVIA